MLKPRRHHPIVKGLALIELFVVMSVIALLIGILLPALRTAREAVAAVVCTGINMMRQLMLAAGVYAVDYDDSFSMNPYTAATGGGPLDSIGKCWNVQIDIEAVNPMA